MNKEKIKISRMILIKIYIKNNRSKNKKEKRMVKKRRSNKIVSLILYTIIWKRLYQCLGNLFMISYLNFLNQIIHRWIR